MIMLRERGVRKSGSQAFRRGNANIRYIWPETDGGDPQKKGAELSRTCRPVRILCHGAVAAHVLICICVYSYTCIYVSASYAIESET